MKTEEEIFQARKRNKQKIKGKESTLENLSRTAEIMSLNAQSSNRKTFLYHLSCDQDKRIQHFSKMPTISLSDRCGDIKLNIPYNNTTYTYTEYNNGSQEWRKNNWTTTMITSTVTIHKDSTGYTAWRESYKNLNRKGKRKKEFFTPCKKYIQEIQSYCSL